ncbi:MAG: hypothetical protein ACI9UN_000205 [Granulosicoccus sp.]|jgi:hypothetical protein
MATGNIESWTGNIAEIGAAYPFVGIETPLMIAGFVFWIWWHITQLRAENREIEEEVRKHGNAESMNKVLNSSDPNKR